MKPEQILDNEKTEAPVEPVTEEVLYPSLVTRIQSVFIDGVIILVLMFITAAVIDHFKETPGWVRGVLFFGLFGVYEPLMLTLGGTIGNRVMNIRVKSWADETKTINIAQSYLRFIVKFVFGWLSFVTIHFNDHRRALHDLISGSLMVVHTKQ